MIFTSLVYPLFLLFAVIVFHMLPRKIKAPWIVICGLLFYLFYAGGFLFVIVIEAIAVYLFARNSNRFAVFLTGLAGVVGLLGYFKYRLMLFSLVSPALGKLFGNSFGFLSFNGPSGINGPISAEHIVVPLALSFYTFEFVHYLVDMRRRTIEKHTFMEFMAFAVFFPTMVAGPIKRFQDFIPKLRTVELSWGLMSTGTLRIVVGVAKKIVIADSMSVLVNPILTGSTNVSAKTLAIALIAYSFKIYMDFSGYSDIAIGSSALFGIKVPENFSFPYLKTNIAKFWKSWHISLTRWIIDYVFIPLGGSRRGLALALLNTLIAMGISGLWHGAATNFVFWGLYHGLLLGLYRAYRTIVKPIRDRYKQIGISDSTKTALLTAYLEPALRVLSGFTTYALVTLGWGLFIMPAGRFLSILSNLAMGVFR
jgi:alginate O-acetyltransferase complex protein AlgI